MFNLGEKKGSIYFGLIGFDSHSGQTLSDEHDDVVLPDVIYNMYVFNQQSGYHCTRSAWFDMRGPRVVKKKL